MRINDAHCHFFSRHFFEVLARDDPRGRFNDSPAESICTTLEWDPPGTSEALADRWLTTLDVQQVARAVLIASVPGDEDSVAHAVARDPERLTGFFMRLSPDGSVETTLAAIQDRPESKADALQR